MPSPSFMNMKSFILTAAAAAAYSNTPTHSHTQQHNRHGWYAEHTLLLDEEVHQHHHQLSSNHTCSQNRQWTKYCRWFDSSDDSSTWQLPLVPGQLSQLSTASQQPAATIQPRNSDLSWAVVLGLKLGILILGKTAPTPYYTHIHHQHHHHHHQHHHTHTPNLFTGVFMKGLESVHYCSKYV